MVFKSLQLKLKLIYYIYSALNEKLQKQIENKIYLNEEERTLYKKIEESIKVFFDMYEDFCLNKTKLDCHNHFQEIRFQLDQHREELKQKIDDVYMEMIDRTKENESSYSKILMRSFRLLLNPLRQDQSKTI